MNIEDTYREFKRICNLFRNDDQYFDVTTRTGASAPLSTLKPIFVIELRTSSQRAQDYPRQIDQNLFALTIGDVCLDELANGEIIKGQSYTKLLIESRIMA